MAEVLTRSTNPAIREVARGLAGARDAQILQVVAMVDGMPNRGAADQLIAPLRGRLARLRPPRPLRFARLLFLPLDPLIVPAARWRAEHPSIPRTVIPVLAAAIEAALDQTSPRPPPLGARGSGVRGRAVRGRAVRGLRRLGLRRLGERPLRARPGRGFPAMVARPAGTRRTAGRTTPLRR